MRPDRFFPGMIRAVIAVGLVAALVTVGEDVMAPEDEAPPFASSANDAASEGPVPDAPVSVTPPSNRTASPENDSDTADLRACGPPCERFLL